MRCRGVPACLGVLALAAAGCSRASPEPRTALLDQARATLAARDAALAGYRFLSTSTRGAERAVHRFAFRAPNHSRGELLEPRHLVRAFDGRALVEVDFERRVHTTFQLELPEAKAALALATTFGPMVPEGLRAPLLPARGLDVRRLPDEGGEERLELSATVEDEAGGRVRTAWVFRWPQMELRSKRSEAAALVRETRVEGQTCDAARALCVPTTLSEWENGQEVGRTELAELELDPALPADAFAPTVPQGFEAQRRRLVEAGGP